MEALVLALPGRGSVEVVTGSAEEVSISEEVTAEAAGCVDCGGRQAPVAPGGGDRPLLFPRDLVGNLKKKNYT